MLSFQGGFPQLDLIWLNLHEKQQNDHVDYLLHKTLT